MTTGQKIKYGIYAVIGLWILSSVIFGGDSSEDTITEEVILPTQGLITTLQETEKDLFKISDEETIDSKEESLIIANYLDNTSDTFTLAEVKLFEANPDANPRGSMIARAATYGFFGYMMGRSMSSHRPKAGAYTDPKAHQKATSKAGSSLNKTASRTTRTRPSGKSGYGGGKSTRSYGG